MNENSSHLLAPECCSFGCISREHFCFYMADVTLKLDKTEFTISAHPWAKGCSWKTAVPSDSFQEAISVPNQVSNTECHPAESTADPGRLLGWGDGFSQIDPHNFLTDLFFLFFLFLVGDSSSFFIVFFLLAKAKATIQTNPRSSGRVKQLFTCCQTWLKI